ncbi:MAG TPA: hypothetical protein VES36_09690, partial [Candidatus Limnocylindrales bacterium]|nr:hypothetical protein [Candidatus Limnocylindrales bacterium]
PELSGMPAAVTTTADDPRLAALGMSSEANAPTPEQPTTATTATAEPATATTDDAAPAAAESSPADAAPAAEGAPAAAESAPADATPADYNSTADADVEGAAADETASPDTRLAERLAQLDERLSGATQPVSPAAPTAANGDGGEASTAIVVKGLGSFGAITSFKQALERVEGVRGVTLSLGPTGEFVYRASHADEFDLVAAIQSIEGPTATIENTDGTLVVTLSRAR